MAGAVPRDSGRAGRPRGRKRDAALDTVILETALGVLAEVGYRGFTVSEVIARAGVSSATVYRRWATMDDLVAAALGSLAPEPVDIDTGSLEGDVGELIRHLGSVLARHGHLSGPGSLGSGAGAPFGEMVDELFVKPRRDALGQILRRAEQRGELSSPAPAPLADCWSHLAGPVHHRIFIRREPFTEAFARSATTFVTAGLRELCGWVARDDRPDRPDRRETGWTR